MQPINRHVLIVMAKEPVAGNTKTRLARTIGDEMAALLYGAMLRDVLALARQVQTLCSDVVLAVAYNPPSAEQVFRTLAPDCLLLVQRGNTLGERLDNCMTHCLQQGYKSAAVLSSDTPLVMPSALVEGFARLEEGNDVALGMCEDGGYYVLASRAPCPTLLRDVVMSTATVAADTLAAAHRAHLRVALLPPSYDIDTEADVMRFWADVQHAPVHVAPHMRALLATMTPWFSSHSSALL